MMIALAAFAWGGNSFVKGLIAPPPPPEWTGPRLYSAANPGSLPATQGQRLADDVRVRALIAKQDLGNSQMMALTVPFALSGRHLRPAPSAGINQAQNQRDSHPNAANPRHPQHPAGSPHGAVGRAATADPAAAPPTPAPAH